MSERHAVYSLLPVISEVARGFWYSTERPLSISRYRIATGDHRRAYICRCRVTIGFTAPLGALYFNHYDDLRACHVNR